MALALDSQSRSQPGNHYVLRVSDITTLLSAATKVVDMVGSMWTGILAWRCVFILLEAGQLNIKQVERIVGGRPPRAWPHGLEWPVSVALLFVLPQAFIEPLFSGAVDWNAAVEYAPAIQVASTPDSTDSSSWGWYNDQGLSRDFYARKAGGWAGVAWGTADSQMAKGGALAPLGGLTCRRIMSSSAPIGSVLLEAIVPCIQIHELTWPTEPVPDAIRSYAYDKSLEFSPGNLNNPFVHAHAGIAVLFDEQNPGYTSPKMTEFDGRTAFPPETKWSGTMTIFLLLGRQDNVDCAPIADNSFGTSSYVTGSVSNVFAENSNSDESCFTYGRVRFTAGVIKAPKSTFISPEVVEYNPAHLTADEIAAAIQPSIWTKEALSLMPVVMAQIAVMNTTQLPTWENINNYTATLIRYAYHANWDVLHSSFEDTDTAMLTVLPAEQRLQATVSFPRLFAWFGITLLVPVTGAIIGYIHSRYSTRALISSTVPVLFTDASAISKDHPELTGMRQVQTQDEKQLLRAMVLQQLETAKPRFELQFAERS